MNFEKNNIDSDIVDLEIIAMMQRSIEDWCKANNKLIDELESQQNKSEVSAVLFKELDQLGLLNILLAQDCSSKDQADKIERSSMLLVAEAAYQFARFSPSIALMLVQQNMACYLLTDIPTTWVALPLYDGVVEWPFQLDIRQDGAKSFASGQWRMISLLTSVGSLLLPICGKNNTSFKLVLLDLETIPDGMQSCGQMLGLRGCDFGDLNLDNYEILDDVVIRQGEVELKKVERLWSQAEVFMMAIRSGIYESTYTVARDYAKDRWQGGKYIIDHSLIRKMLADLYQEKCGLYESWQAIVARFDTKLALSDGQMGLALKSAERLPWAASDGIQILGGNGYMEDYNQARCFRDAKQCELLLGHPQARGFAIWQTELSA